MHSLNGRLECSYLATNERRSSLAQYLTYAASSKQDFFDFSSRRFHLYAPDIGNPTKLSVRKDTKGFISTDWFLEKVGFILSIINGVQFCSF